MNKFLDVLTSDKDLAVEILDYTKTASMLKDVTPTFDNPSQSDIDKYAAEGRIVDVTLGNRYTYSLGRFPGGERERYRGMAAGGRDL